MTKRIWTKDERRAVDAIKRMPWGPVALDRCPPVVTAMARHEEITVGVLADYLDCLCEVLVEVHGDEQATEAELSAERTEREAAGRYLRKLLGIDKVLERLPREAP